MVQSENENRSRVGVRELRQNLSVYLGRVKQGESLEVTEHGRRVARLVPAAAEESRWDQLVADGRIVLGKGSLAELGPPPPGIDLRPLSEILQEMRDEEPR
jgi:prevent-host-death family protein